MLQSGDGESLNKSHPGEYHDDQGGVQLRISPATYRFAFAAAINSCNLGYDIGVSTQVGRLIQKQFDLSDLQREFFIGSLNGFAMIGCLCAPWICDQYGRRRSFIISAIFFIVGVLIMTFAGNFAVLMFGRVFVGIGVGFGLAIDPIYISEISPARFRGELVTWSEIATNVGIVLGFTSGFAVMPLANRESQWRLMIAAGAILPCFLIFASLYIMQESPRWLIATNKETEAKDILTQIYPAEYDVDAVIVGIKDALQREQIAEKVVGWKVFLSPTPAFRRMLLVGIGMAIAQQAVGIDAIQYYLLDVLHKSGVKSETGSLRILIALGLVKLTFIVIGGQLFDRKGRRPLLLVSLIGMAVALFGISVAFFGNDSPNTGFVVVGLAVYLAFFSLGIGPVAWLVPSEVFATCIRAKAMSVATFFNRATATIMSSTFLSTARAISWAGFFFLLTVVCLLIAAFVYLLLPETKGRSLEEMSVYFAELTGDKSILEAEANIVRERMATTQLELRSTMDQDTLVGAGPFQLSGARGLPLVFRPTSELNATIT